MRCRALQGRWWGWATGGGQARARVWLLFAGSELGIACVVFGLISSWLPVRWVIVWHLCLTHEETRPQGCGVEVRCKLFWRERRWGWGSMWRWA